MFCNFKRKMADNNIPKELVKYYACNEHNFNALTNNYLWASDPLKFNDPFDCPLEAWNAESFTVSALKKILNPTFYHKFKDIFKNDAHEQFIWILKMLLGVVCVNEPIKENEDLLWGYYTNQQGFAISFIKEMLSQDLELEPVQVVYKIPCEFEKFSIPTIIETPDELFPIFIEWIKQKKNIWQNETEYRYIFLDIKPFIAETRKKYYKSQSIKRITLGLRFFGDNLEKINGDKEAFIYNHTKESNPFHYRLLKHLIENPNFDIWWMSQGSNLNVSQMPIKLSYYDPFKIIIKIENPYRSI